MFERHLSFVMACPLVEAIMDKSSMNKAGIPDTVALSSCVILKFIGFLSADVVTVMSSEYT